MSGSLWVTCIGTKTEVCGQNEILHWTLTKAEKWMMFYAAAYCFYWGTGANRWSCVLTALWFKSSPDLELNYAKKWKVQGLLTADGNHSLSAFYQAFSNWLWSISGLMACSCWIKGKFCWVSFRVDPLKPGILNFWESLSLQNFIMGVVIFYIFIIFLTEIKQHTAGI